MAKPPATTSPEDVSSTSDPRFADLPPSKTEWFSLIINFTFVAAGLLLLPSSPDVGIVTVAFFGTCLATTLAFQWRRHLDRIFRVRTVEVVGGVRIKPQRRMIFLMGGWLVVLGLLMYANSRPYPPLFQWLCLLIATFGIGFVGAALLGRLPSGFLQFDPEGLTIGVGRWHMQVPWKNITRVTQGEYHMNPVIYIDIVIDEMRISPPSQRLKALKKMNFNRAMLGAPFMLMPMHYGIPAPVLAGAIRRYCKSEKARVGLIKSITYDA